MPLFTTNYFKELARSYSGTREINEAMSAFESARTNGNINEDEKFDIFLSHSYLDKEIVYGIYLLLKRKGYKVYVDWIVDKHLSRENVTKESAQLIRTRMKNSKTLLLAISENARISKWMPWELGYVDGNVNSCAILPLVEGNATKLNFKRVEYLLLYPYIKLAEIGSNNSEIYVTESAYRFVELSRWTHHNVKPLYNYNNINFL